jgi:hypothetical protein
MNRRQNINDSGQLVCEWCGTRFDRTSWNGRTPRFCRASHRVRACERRRGLLRARQRPERVTLPPPKYQLPMGAESHRILPGVLTFFADQNMAVGHEVARSATTLIRGTTMQDFHRVRPGAPPNKRGDVPSLCGTTVTPLGCSSFMMSGPGCRKCASLAELHPVEPVWWDAGTQRVAATLLDDLRSSLLAVGQARAGKRDKNLTLNRLEQELRNLTAHLGRPDPLQPSLHHSSITP